MTARVCGRPMTYWRSFKTGGESILWALHVAYAWLPIGLARGPSHSFCFSSCTRPS
jgi:uncharacterized protein involved in response to NO